MLVHVSEPLLLFKIFFSSIDLNTTKLELPELHGDILTEAYCVTHGVELRQSKLEKIPDKQKASFLQLKKKIGRIGSQVCEPR